MIFINFSLHIYTSFYIGICTHIVISIYCSTIIDINNSIVIYTYLYHILY